MFKRRESKDTEPEQYREDEKMEALDKIPKGVSAGHRPNSIVKGSKLTGDIIINYDMEMDGEVEGNITSEQKSNVIIKGSCKGNIHTKEGNVDIEGKMSKGDIVAGGDIRITGSFKGGKVESRGTIYVNGEFSGKLEAKDIEIGAGAKGSGELFYREHIAIAKGADVEVNISRLQGSQKEQKKNSEAKVVNIERTVQEIKEEKKK